MITMLCAPPFSKGGCIKLFHSIIYVTLKIRKGISGTCSKTLQDTPFHPPFPFSSGRELFSDQGTHSLVSKLLAILGIEHQGQGQKWVGATSMILTFVP